MTYCVSVWKLVTGKVFMKLRGLVLSLYFFSTQILLSVIFILLLHSRSFARSNSPTPRHSAHPASWRQTLTFSTYWGFAGTSHHHGYCSQSGSKRRPHSCPGVRGSIWCDGVSRKGGGERGDNQRAWYTIQCKTKEVVTLYLRNESWFMKPRPACHMKIQ